MDRRFLLTERVEMAMTVLYLQCLDDNWVLECLQKEEGELFYGGDLFALIHENTEKRMKMSRYYEYSFGNW